MLIKRNDAKLFPKHVCEYCVPTMSKQEKNERPINFERKGILDIVLNGVLASSANDIPMQNLFVLNLSKKTNNSIT